MVSTRTGNKEIRLERPGFRNFFWKILVKPLPNISFEGRQGLYMAYAGTGNWKLATEMALAERVQNHTNGVESTAVCVLKQKSCVQKKMYVFQNIKVPASC